MRNKLIIEKIALAYQEAPDEVDSIVEDDRRTIHDLINTQFNDLSKHIRFIFENEDPYNYVTIDEMYKDFRKGFIRVNTSGNESKFWGRYHNLQFRAIHDYIHCKYKLDFNFGQEITAWESQMRLTQTIYQERSVDWQLFEAILRSEIIYQAAVKEHFKEFHIDQKIILKNLFN